MKYKLIAVDIDDTLLNRKKEISPITKAALLQAQENGVKVAVASGRLPYGVRPFAEQLEVFRYGGYYMGFNGGAIMNSRDELIGKCYLDSKYIEPVYDILRPTNVTTMVHKGATIYADNKVNDYTHIESDVIGLPLNVVDDLPNFIDWDIHKFLIAGDPQELPSIVRVPREHFSRNKSQEPCSARLFFSYFMKLFHRWDKAYSDQPASAESK